MNTKQVYTIVLKVIGIIALWKTIQVIGPFLSSFAIIPSLINGPALGGGFFMLFAVGSMMLNFIAPVLAAFLCLFRTDWLLETLKLTSQENTNLPLKENQIYHILVLIFGFVLLLHGSGNFISTDIKTDTHKEFTSNNVINQQQFSRGSNVQYTLPQEKTTVTNSRTRKVNYYALIELIAGAIILLKATDLAQRFEDNFNYKNSRNKFNL